MATTVSPDSLTTRPPGEIGWVNIPVTDIGRGVAFYTAVFSWEVHPDIGNGSPGHSVIDGHKQHHFFRKCNLSGSFSILNNPEHLVKVPDAPGTAYAAIGLCLLSDDFDATLKKVVEHGGKVKNKIVLYEGIWGNLAEIIDTEGNYLGVWAPPKKEQV
ncbi:Glyoxalase/Bleomycin resistance protein/Dihydroxybiphenyl dioxygenase [Immersiella caudata]|uniref:Glyoxalase/Bleomycin resistance protein/Dihydroxybiphenyl dioxygenase n=1 Tax=Immersiella caudata TaxID=314043 RepID=A0AA39WSU5_9PEZI|nr:Glyoxalase/Bleomycin resistance protein/Dihydroxybiphenyl dioxygenase [Immersiella caudata]